MVDVVAHVGGETPEDGIKKRVEAKTLPVISAVLEEVHNWHSSVGKSMNEQSLQDSLGIMESMSITGIVNHSRLRSRAYIRVENIWHKVKELFWFKIECAWSPYMYRTQKCT